MKVDPMAKFQLRKQAKVIKDNSLQTVKLAILGTGELFGLEECQMKPSQSKPKARQSVSWSGSRVRSADPL